MKNARVFLAAVLGLLCTLVWAAPAPADPPAGRSFIWVGAIGSQFTDAQYRYIANNYAYMIFSKFHGGWDIAKHYEAARELKLRNPALKVFAYFSSAFWFNAYKFGQNEFKEEWYLHDIQGKRIPSVPGQKVNFFVDVTNPEYRAWALNILAGWMSLTLEDGTPLYDGIHFDGTVLYNAYMDDYLILDRKVQRLVSLLGIQKVRDLNDGTTSLIKEAHERFPNALIAFNGISQDGFRYNRCLDLLQYADIAVDESFSWRFYQPLGEVQMVKNIKLMSDAAYANKIFFEKANVTKAPGEGITAAEHKQYQRYSFGCFLLGHRPGYTFFKYGETGPKPSEMLYAAGGEVRNLSGIDLNAGVMSLDFGDPSGPYTREKTLYKRDFTNGLVYVNMKNTPQSVTLSEPLYLMEDGATSTLHAAGDVLQIGPKDAVFLMRPQAMP